MSLTSNFDFCVELGISSVKDIFHLAFKSEDRYPHNVGPIDYSASGRNMVINVSVLDDEDRPADLSFQDEKHILFSFPFEMIVETEDAPDPSLSQVTMDVQVSIPALLGSWVEEDEEVLGLSFHEVTSADVIIEPGSLQGLPIIDAQNFANAIHSKYDLLPHTYPLGANILNLYDGDRDPALVPVNGASPHEIEVILESHGGNDYLKVTAPIWVSVPLPGSLGTYESFGRIVFWRLIESDDTTITVNMNQEPVDSSLATIVELDNASPARNAIIANLTPLAKSAVNAFGTITEPAFTEIGASALLQEQIADYINGRRYPVYTPKSPDPVNEPLTTPVGFLLVADGVLAVLLNRRNGTAADDNAPDNFLGANELAIAVGLAKTNSIIDAAIEAEFPDLDDGGEHISTDEGDATLESLNVSLSGPSSHGESEGHLWVTGDAEVHIDCWPDPDVSFEGPIFIDSVRTEEDGECGLELQARAGDFDFDQSCCDVFLDLIIPIVGWIMLAVIQSTIDEVGGELAEEIAGSQERLIDPIPKLVNDIAEVTACLEDFLVRSDGMVMPGSISIRRLGTSFEDLEDDRDLPGP